MTDLLAWKPPIEERPAHNEDGWRDIAAEFRVFHRDNPEVFALFKRFANEAFNSGRTYYSARDIFPRIRWYTMIESPGDPDGVKINNNWSAFYSRLLASEDPKFRCFFRYRKSKADALTPGIVPANPPVLKTILDMVDAELGE